MSSLLLRAARLTPSIRAFTAPTSVFTAATRRSFTAGRVVREAGKQAPSAEAKEAAAAGSAEAAAAAKPRAVGVTAVGKRRRKLVWVAGLGGTALFVAIVANQYDYSFGDLTARVRQTLEAWTETTRGDPNVEDLQRALGPVPPEGYVNVIIALEDVLVQRDWDRRYGYRYEPREGIKELLRSLTDPSLGVYVTLWSENSSTTANEIMEKLTQAIGGPAAHTPPLGVEHMFLREKNTRKEKRLEYFNRDPRSVLLIDANPMSEVLNPQNTVLVEPMSKHSKGAQDMTLVAVKALVTRIREDMQMHGDVNVPRALKRLRGEAAAAGFSSDSAAGLYEYLSSAAEKEEEMERQRREAGLGGLMRRTASSSTVLRNKVTTVEAASMRPFRDPSMELGEDSILAKKVREVNSKLFARPGQ